MGDKTHQVIELYNRYVMPTYTRSGQVFVKGKGSRVWDIEGNEYLDLFPGWGVSGLGHCHLKVVDTIKKQAGKLLHISNNYYSQLQALLAKKIIENSFDGKVFFCNSGAEAIEAAIKLSRAYGASSGRFGIVTMINSFHGRTLGALTATGQLKYQQGFEPLLQGFSYVPFNDIASLQKAISEDTIAVMLELIQGEGGINVASKEYVRELRRICDEKDILLIFDEVQTGMGRAGEMFCFKHYKVTPDVMALAKSLGAGLPIGAMVASKKVADVLKPGMHASTFGGSPICAAVSLAVFEVIEKEGLLDNVREQGLYAFSRLNQLKEQIDIIKEVRGMGLMIGIELTIDGRPIVEKCIAKGLLVNCTQDKVLRLLPALNIRKQELKRGLDILEDVLRKAR